MAVALGTRFGPYEIGAPLGAGGMGEVYRARDTKLNRDVAIKVLLSSVASDPDRLARFGREAQLLASLNHPNIAGVYGLEESDSITALVMELVEGPTLADRIARGPVALDDALAIAAQIATALEAAHERGVIHRDLKPANIKVRPDGTVKVLDFGLAKAFDPTAQGSAIVTMSPTLSVHATMAGVLLGTAAYMSPEQASGKPVDKRSDLWAFGVVLLEMLTGQQVFTGETTSHVLASVLKSDPDWSTLPADTPVAIRRLLRRCLSKERRERLADASDARLEIEDAMSSSVEQPAPAGARGSWLLWSGWVAAAFIVVAAGLVVRRFDVPALQSTPVYSSIDVPPEHVLGEDDFLVQLPIHTPIVFTPDGRSVIIQAARDRKPQLFLRSLDRPEARPIVGTEGARVPFVSPDGKWVGFWAANELRKVPIDGGEAITICALRAGLGPNGAAWGPGDTILFGDDSARRIMRVSAGGGVPVPATDEAPVNRRHVTPFFLPDGRRFLFADISAIDASDAQLMVKDLGDGVPRLVIAGAIDGRLLPAGQLIFMRLGTLMTVRFDSQRAAIAGDAVVVMRGVMQNGLRVRGGANSTGAGMFAVSNTGTLAVVRGGVIGGEDTRLVWVTKDNQMSSADPESGAPKGGRLAPRISPDGSRAMVTVITAVRRELWFADWVRHAWTQCAECAGNMTGFSHAWAPDGQHVLLVSSVDTLVAHTIDGSVSDRVIVTEPNRLLQPAEWLPDGRVVYLSVAPQSATTEIKLLDAGATVGHAIAEGLAPSVSPDGHWLAYTSRRTGQPSVVVQAFPGPGPRTQVSAGQGSDASWSGDGKTLYYVDATGAAASMIAVDIRTTGGLSAGSAKEVFRRPIVQCSSGRCYDVATSSNGTRFLMRDEQIRKRESVTRMDLILNWTATIPN